MNSRFHPGTFTAGIVFMGLGIAFLLEAAEVWTFQLRHLATLGPLTIIAIGIAVIASTIWSGSTADHWSEDPTQLPDR